MIKISQTLHVKERKFLLKTETSSLQSSVDETYTHTANLYLTHNEKENIFSSSKRNSGKKGKRCRASENKIKVFLEPQEMLNEQFKSVSQSANSGRKNAEPILKQ